MLVLAVEVAPSLHIVCEIEYLVQPIQELSLSSIRGSVNHNSIGLVLKSEYEELAYVLNEPCMLGTLDNIGYHIWCSRMVLNLGDVSFEIRPNIWKFLLEL